MSIPIERLREIKQAEIKARDSVMENPPRFVKGLISTYAIEITVEATAIDARMELLDDLIQEASGQISSSPSETTSQEPE